MGGGGFSVSVADAPLEHYIAGLAPVDAPRICLLPTASGDPDDQIQRFYRAFRGLGELSHLSLFRLGTHPMSPEDHLLAQDVIYVGGGSLANLLAIWSVHELDRVLPEAWERGIVLCGVSAGSMCWFEAGVTRSHGRSRPAAGLGLLPGSNSVHDSSDPERRACHRSAVARACSTGLRGGRRRGPALRGHRARGRGERPPRGGGPPGGRLRGRAARDRDLPAPARGTRGRADDAPVEIAEFRDARRARLAPPAAAAPRNRRDASLLG